MGVFFARTGPRNDDDLVVTTVAVTVDDLVVAIVIVAVTVAVAGGVTIAVVLVVMDGCISMNHKDKQTCAHVSVCESLSPFPPTRTPPLTPS